MARHKLTKEQQIKGIRKALKNPRTPKQFLPSLKKRLMRLRVLAFLFLLPTIARAQFQGYVSPQTVQQVLATNVSCTGSAQAFTAQNLGQTQHYVTVTPVTPATTTITVKIMGQDVNGNNIQISDAIFPATTFSASNLVTGTGYFPRIVVLVTCSPVAGSFSLTYSGTSASPNVNAGSYLLNQFNKTLFLNASQGTTVGATTFVTPYGSSYGKLFFQFATAAVAGSSLQIICQSGGVLSAYQTWNFALATVTTPQVFQVPDFECPLVLAQYTSGGASANTYNWDYVFDVPGRIGATSSATTLGASQNLGSELSEKGSRWDVLSAPAAGTQSTASRAAGTAGVRHVADCVSFSAGAIAAPAATALQINLRDGASGAGTIIWTQTVTIPATAAPHYSQSFCGLNLIGTAATAMTLEFSAALASESESVTLTGYDVQ